MTRTPSLLLALLLALTLSACSGDSSMDDDPINDVPTRLTGTWTGTVIATQIGDDAPEEQPVSITVVQGIEVNGQLRLDRVEGTGSITTQARGELTFEIEGQYLHPTLSLGLLFPVTPPIGTISGSVSEDRRTILATMAGPDIGGSVTFMLERQ